MSFNIFENPTSLKIGKLLGNILNKKIFKNEVLINTEGKRLEDINVQTVKYGKEIPIVYGKVKLAGNIIWDSGLKELKKIITKSSNSSNQKIEYNYTKYEYNISLAIALCEGEIYDVSRIWINNIIIDKSLYNIRIYKGLEDQLPDPLIEKIEGKSRVCAFRGIAYVVFEDFPISKFKNKIPKFHFEVIKNDNAKNPDSLQNLINSVVIIPGSGEYVYDTTIQTKSYYKNEPYEYEEVKINCNTEHNKADSLVSLDQLKSTLPNVKWVSPVVNWYATDINAGLCKVVPGVEFKDDKTKITPDEWQVSSYNRKNAHLILQKNNQPIYGGTINDGSIVGFLDSLNNKGYSIMFYPMVLIDGYDKPWRGRMYANDVKGIENFFDGKDGYNKFILHYAKLVKGKVKAFLIGSEMVGLTKFRTSDNKFLVVDKLIDLAKQVKNILGKDVMISYAADWSEYHHTDGGWYFLDKLWASEYIDFIGIDTYFPLTNNDKTTYDVNEIINGWESGEGYDYYIDGNGKKQYLGQEYAWKNIKWWWENKHYNPDGKQTEWIPKSKKIWFTELGFPSIDCATNQPNVFYDPGTAESNIPKHSKGQVDFQAQKLGLLATEMKWKDSEMIENKFVWAWDARPYPYFPDKLDVWGDGDCWKKGHWIQGKFFQSNLNSILFDICERVNLDQIDISQINHDVIGFCVHDGSTTKDVMDDLSMLYSFKVHELEDQLLYSPNKNREVHQIESDDIVINPDKLESSLSIIKLGDENIISNVKLNYILFDQDYILTNSSAKNYLIDNDDQLQISLPIIITQSEADELVEKLLDNYKTKDVIVSLTLPITYAFLKVNDLIEIEYDDQPLILQILHIAIDETSTITLVCERAD